MSTDDVSALTSPAALDAQSTVTDFLSQAGKHDTSVHENVALAVTHERVLPTEHENIQTGSRPLHVPARSLSNTLQRSARKSTKTTITPRCSPSETSRHCQRNIITTSTQSRRGPTTIEMSSPTRT